MQVILAAVPRGPQRRVTTIQLVRPDDPRLVEIVDEQSAAARNWTTAILTRQAAKLLPVLIPVAGRTIDELDARAEALYAAEADWRAFHQAFTVDELKTLVTIAPYRGYDDEVFDALSFELFAESQAH